MTKHFLADLAERTVWTFVQAYAAFWLAAGADWDHLASLDGLKVAVVAAALVVASAVVRKPIGSPDTASVLPAQQEPAPVDAAPADPYLTAAIWSERLGQWSTVYLHPEATEDEGTFVLTTATHDGLQVAEYRPDRSGTHAPVGPTEMSNLGLRPKLPEPF